MIYGNRIVTIRDVKFKLKRIVGIFYEDITILDRLFEKIRAVGIYAHAYFSLGCFYAFNNYFDMAGLCVYMAKQAANDKNEKESNTHNSDMLL